MLAPLEKKYDVKIILGSKGAASNGCDFAFSQREEPDLHLLLNKASGIRPGCKERAGTQPCPLTPCSSAIEWLPGDYKPGVGFVLAPAQPKLSLFSRRAALQMELCVIPCK